MPTQEPNSFESQIHIAASRTLSVNDGTKYYRGGVRLLVDFIKSTGLVTAPAQNQRTRKCYSVTPSPTHCDSQRQVTQRHGARCSTQMHLSQVALLFAHRKLRNLRLTALREPSGHLRTTTAAAAILYHHIFVAAQTSLPIPYWLALVWRTPAYRGTTC